MLEILLIVIGFLAIVYVFGYCLMKMAAIPTPKPKPPIRQSKPADVIPVEDYMKRPSVKMMGRR